MNLPGITNRAVAAFIEKWAAHTGAANVRVISEADDAQLIQEALAAGEIEEVTGGGRYFSRSHPKDTARSEERTFVATASPADRGAYNNWVDSAEIKPKVEALMKDSCRGKTMYVIPYCMGNADAKLAKYGVGVQLSDTRTVVLHMIRMSRVGVSYMHSLPDDSDFFVRGVHIAGDLDNLKQGTPEDMRHFVTVADERLILHFGSAYGGNALLGKIAHGLRQASYDGYATGEFLGEQFMLSGIRDKQTGRTFHVVGGFPSASGKTNLAMIVPPPALADRYEVFFYGDDIAWIWVNPQDGRLYASNPEYGVFGVLKDTNESTNPNAVISIRPGTQTLFTNCAFNPKTKDVWWEGKTPEPPANVGDWIDWRGQRIADRSEANRNDDWAHPNSRFTTTLKNVPNISPDWDDPRGVPVDAIIFGGRVREREPLVRAVLDPAEGVYDGLTLGAEATFAAEGKQGVFRYDPMSLRPFFSYDEGNYAAHWLRIMSRASKMPVFAHVNWFQRDDGGRYLWPGYSDNLRPLLWLWDLAEGRATGQQTPIGLMPKDDELNLAGLNLSASDLDKLLNYNPDLWQGEVENRAEHLRQFGGLPDAIWQAHKRLAEAVGAS